MAEKRHIQDISGRYELCLGVLNKSPDITEYNKQQIKNFLQLCEDDNIGQARRLKLLMQLTKLARWIKKDFNTATEQDIRQLKRDLTNNVLKKEDRELIFQQDKEGKNHISSYKITGHSSYSDSYKADFLKALKKFYKVMYGNNLDYPAIVKWMRIEQEVKEIPALSYEESERLADYSNQLRYKALIRFLFDSGARIEEALNVKLKDLGVQDGEDATAALKAYDTELKKDDYFICRIRVSKTKARPLSLSLASKQVAEWISHHPYKTDPESYLFIDRLRKPLGYIAVRSYLGRLGQKVLRRKVTPHLFRHSSATYYANKLPYFQFCKRYGWTFSSTQPQRYIDRSGIEEKETARIIKDSSVHQLKKENEDLRNNINVMKAQIDRMKEQIVKEIVEDLKKKGAK